MEGIKQFVNDSWLTINDVAIKGGNTVKTTGVRFFDSIKNIQNTDLSNRASILLQNTVPSFIRNFATTVVSFVYSHPVIALASLVGMYVITRPKVREYLQNAVVWLVQKAYAVMPKCTSLVMKYKLPVSIICCAVFGATILFEKFLQYTPNGMISTFFNAIVKYDVGGINKILQIVGSKKQDLFWFFVERSIIDLETIVTMKSISFVLGRFFGLDRECGLYKAIEEKNPNDENIKSLIKEIQEEKPNDENINKLMEAIEEKKPNDENIKSLIKEIQKGKTNNKNTNQRVQKLQNL